MSDYSKTFDWVQFPEGRARFSGGIRGGDERGHETFTVEVDGISYYGEINHAFLPNGNDFNVEITSFGYTDKQNVANPSLGARREFTASALRIVRELILKLTQAGLDFEDRPSALGEFQNSRFKGRAIFRGGWAREVRSHDAIPTQSAEMEIPPCTETSMAHCSTWRTTNEPR